MNPNDDRVEAIFHAALELPDPAQREALITSECGDDLALEARVRRLLGSHDHSGLLHAAAAALLPEIEAELARLKPEEADERIGPYKLLQQIGEGGFGVVWMAEQEQPVRRRVALKVIKLGMDTKEVIARFEQEQQALAMMDHPNIAKVFDAGATQYGRPFFAMELVRGVKITDYCDERKLSVQERLELFIKVCHAVQHAHQKGIIHRDLKPSNILVTEGDDHAPLPKVIDFGVAKAMDRTLTNKTLATHFEQMIGTPAYMSPEQTGAGPMDIDTRSDIYSLGSVLYEMLTGKPPFDPQALMQVGPEEMRRVIREEEPQKPSTRLSILQETELKKVAAHRNEDATKVESIVRGDLDWIVVKALEKDRNRRYETANEFAQDIQRHLSKQPVLAHPPSRPYRFGRWAMRNAEAINYALLVIVACVGAPFYVIRAAKARKTTAIVTNLYENMLHGTHSLGWTVRSVGERVVVERKVPDTRSLRAAMDEAVAGLDTGVVNPSDESTLCYTIADVYSSLGDFAKADALLHRSLALQKNALGKDNPVIGLTLVRLAKNLQFQGKAADAEGMYIDALAIERKALGEKHPVTGFVLNGLATVLHEQRKLVEAERTYRLALAIQKNSLPAEDFAIAASLFNLAIVLQDQGKSAEAEDFHQQALGIKRKLLGDEHRDVFNSLNHLAYALQHQGKLTEAEAMHRDAITMGNKLLGTEHTDVVTLKGRLAEVLSAQKRFSEARPLAEEAVASYRSHPEWDRNYRSKFFEVLDANLVALGDQAAHESLLREIKAFHSEK